MLPTVNSDSANTRARRVCSSKDCPQPFPFQTAHSTISSKRLPDRRSFAKFVRTNLIALANSGEGRRRDSHCGALFSRSRKCQVLGTDMSLFGQSTDGRGRSRATTERKGNEGRGGEGTKRKSAGKRLPATQQAQSALKKRLNFPSWLPRRSHGNHCSVRCLTASAAKS